LLVETRAARKALLLLYDDLHLPGCLRVLPLGVLRGVEVPLLLRVVAVGEWHQLSDFVGCMSRSLDELIDRSCPRREVQFGRIAS
jgi:hypothetical protein